MEQIFFDLISNLGYFGVFLSSLIGSATLIFPAPSFVFIVTSGALLNPLLVSIAAALGSTLGEFTGYLVGYGGEKLLEKKIKHSRLKKYFNKLEHLSKTYTLSLIIFIFAALPLPFDFIGIFAGTIKYDTRKFFIATFLGKLVKSVILAYTGFAGLEIIKEFL